MSLLDTLHASADYEATLPLACDPAWGLTADQVAEYLRTSDASGLPAPPTSVDRVTVRTLSEGQREALEAEAGAAPMRMPDDLEDEGERFDAQRAWARYHRARFRATVRQGVTMLGTIAGGDDVVAWLDARAPSAAVEGLKVELVSHIRNVSELGELGKARFGTGSGSRRASPAPTPGAASTAGSGASSECAEPAAAPSNQKTGSASAAS